jgi:hypothetical protein
MDTDGYRRQLALLREENEFLRAAAHAFGELAERLANELRQLRAEQDARISKPVRARRSAARLNS